MQVKQLGKKQASAAGRISYWSYSKQSNSDLLLNIPNSAKAAPGVKQHLLNHWRFFTILSSLPYFSILGNPILFQKTPTTYSSCLVISLDQCLAVTLIKYQHSSFHLNAKIPVWHVEDILVPTTKACRTEGGKQHDSDQACWYHYAAIQEPTIFWSYLLMNIYSFTLTRVYEYYLYCYISTDVPYGQILKGLLTISCIITVLPQGSFHINTLIRGLSIW